MRILSAEEMDCIFGGQSTGTAAPTQGPTVTVTAYRIRGGNYWAGASDFGGGWSSYDEQSNGGYSGGSAYYYYPAFTPPIGPNDLRCTTTAAAVPGMGPDPGWSFAIIPSYAYKNAAGDVILRQSKYSTVPSGYDPIRGLTSALQSSWNGTGWQGGTTTIYAGAFESIPSGFRSHAYFNESGAYVSTGKAFNNLTAVEHAVMVSAHEARHQWQNEHPGAFPVHINAQGKSDLGEADAEGYAVRALDRYRAGNKGPNCPTN